MRHIHIGPNSTLRLRLLQFGDSVGPLLPREVLGHLQVEVGDSMHLAEAEDGYPLTSNDAVDSAVFG